MSAKSFQDLPQEVIARIIDYLEPSHAAVLARTCRATHELAEVAVYKSVNLRPKYDMKRANERFPNLHDSAEKAKYTGVNLKRDVYERQAALLIQGVHSALLAESSRARHVKSIRACFAHEMPDSHCIIHIVRLAARQLDDLEITFYRGYNCYFNANPRLAGVREFWNSGDFSKPIRNLATFKTEVCDLDHLTKCLSIAPNIERLDISVERFSCDDGLEPFHDHETVANRLADFARRCPKSHRLRVLRCTEVNIVFLEVIATLVDNSPGLEVLSINGSEWHGPISARVAQTLRNKKSLRYFELSGDCGFLPKVEDDTELLDIGFELLKMGARMDKLYWSLAESEFKIIEPDFGFPRSTDFAYDASWIDHNEDVLKFCASDVVLRTFWKARPSRFHRPRLHGEMFRYSHIQSRQLPSRLPDVHGAINARQFLATASPTDWYESELRPYDFISARQRATKAVASDSPSSSDAITHFTAATAPTLVSVFEEWYATGGVAWHDQTVRPMWAELEEIRLGGLGIVFAHSVAGRNPERSES